MMLRRLVAASVGVAGGIFGLAAAAAFTQAWIVAALIGVIAGVLVAWWTARSLPLDASACPRGVAIVSALATLLALVQLGRLAVFMTDPSRIEYSFNPGSEWERRHSCLSAYHVAGEAASSTSSIYDNQLYSMPDDDPSKPRKPRTIDSFNVDVYEYPPPFLLLPRALRLLTPDFLHLRPLWFALCGGALLLAIILVARFMGPVPGTRALLLSPFIWAGFSTMSTLQKGNVQVVVVAVSVIAMMMFERRRWVGGGALLGFVTVSKLFPGLLIVYLMVRRQWRAVAWTAVFGIAYSVAAYLDLGRGAYEAFLDHLPGLVGGEAFPAFRRLEGIAINLSIPASLFKLKLFDGPEVSFATVKTAAWAFTLVVLVTTVFAARWSLRDSEKPLVWIAIITIATLRSPFLPPAYGTIPALWLLTLVSVHRAPAVLFLLAWAALNVNWPIDKAIDPRWLVVLSTLQQAITILLVVLALRHERGVRAVSDPRAVVA